MRLNDLFTLADLWPSGRITSSASIYAPGEVRSGREQFLALFESGVLAFGDYISFAAIEAAINEFAQGFQDLLRGFHEFSRGRIALCQELGEFSGHRDALGLTSFRFFLVHVSQTTDFRFEISVATQLEERTASL